MLFASRYCVEFTLPVELIWLRRTQWQILPELAHIVNKLIPNISTCKHAAWLSSSPLPIWYGSKPPNFLVYQLSSRSISISAMLRRSHLSTYLWLQQSSVFNDKPENNAAMRHWIANMAQQDAPNGLQKRSTGKSTDTLCKLDREPSQNQKGPLNR